MPKTRAQATSARKTTKAKGKAKAKEKPAPKKLSEITKCKKCKKDLYNHSSLIRHEKQKNPRDPKEIEARKKKAKEKKRAHNAENYKWRRKGYTLAIARKVLSGELTHLPPRPTGSPATGAQ